MITRTVDLKKERERAKKPGAGYPINTPTQDAIVRAVDEYAKKLKKPPAQR